MYTIWWILIYAYTREAITTVEVINIYRKIFNIERNVQDKYQSEKEC